MATAWLSAAETVDLPDICLKTGGPTAVHLPCEAVGRPTWAPWIWLVFGFWAYVFLRAVGTERVVVALPVSQPAFRRHQRSQQGCAAVAAAGVAVVVVAQLRADAAVVRSAALPWS